MLRLNFSVRNYSATVKDNFNPFKALERAKHSAFFGISMIILTPKMSKLEQKTYFLEPNDEFFADISVTLTDNLDFFSGLERA